MVNLRRRLLDHFKADRLHARHSGGAVNECTDLQSISRTLSDRQQAAKNLLGHIGISPKPSHSCDLCTIGHHLFQLPQRRAFDDGDAAVDPGSSAVRSQRCACVSARCGDAASLSVGDHVRNRRGCKSILVRPGRVTALQFEEEILQTCLGADLARSHQRCIAFSQRHLSRLGQCVELLTPSPNTHWINPRFKRQKVRLTNEPDPNAFWPMFPIPTPSS